MSDFMRDIVQEALRGGGGRSRNTSRNQPSLPHSDFRKTDVTDVMPEISRPNYQRDKKEQRLDMFIEKSMAPLQRMSLVQGKTGEDCATGCKSSIADADGPGMIGQSCEGLDFWYYPELRTDLFPELGIRHMSAKSTGVIAADQCKPGQLFLLDEGVNASRVDCEISWNRGSGSSFKAIFTGNASSEILNILQGLYERCQRIGKEQIGKGSARTYLSLEPSQFLSKHLGIDRGDSIAVWEGLSRYRSVALLDRAYKQGMSARVKYTIEAEYLLLTGTREEITEAAAVMQKVIEPYL